MKIVANNVAIFQSAFTTNDGLVYLSNLGNFEVHITNSAYNSDVDTILDLPSRLNPSFDATPNVLASLTDSGLIIWNSDSGQKYLTLDIAPDVYFRLSPDGKTIATWNNKSDLISIWDMRHQTKRTVIKVNDVINKVIFSADSELFAVGTHRNKHLIKLWEVNNLQAVYELLGHKDVISGLSFSKDKTLLASSSWDGTIKIWNTKTHQELKTFRSAFQNPIKVEFSPDERSLIALSDAGIEIWCPH
jgi:WD40 repeat protein